MVLATVSPAPVTSKTSWARAGMRRGALPAWKSHAVGAAREQDGLDFEGSEQGLPGFENIGGGEDVAAEEGAGLLEVGFEEGGASVAGEVAALGVHKHRLS